MNEYNFNLFLNILHLYLALFNITSPSTYLAPKPSSISVTTLAELPSNVN